MNKNSTQLQHEEGLSPLLNRFGTEDQCREALFALRWPEGFLCPECSGREYCFLAQRHLYQCNRCHHQTSVTAGTVLEATKLPLTVWFQAIYLISRNKDGISTLNLARQLGISNNSAWMLKHKLMQTMLEGEDRHPLVGSTELDTAHWGGNRHDGKHLPRYLAEYNFRSKRRLHLEKMVDLLLSEALHIPPMPQRLLKLPEVNR